MTKSEQRKERIAQSVARIREFAGDQKPNYEILGKIKAELIELAKEKDLFSVEDFPPPEAGSKRANCLYRLSEDEDHRFALYANAAQGTVNAPPHDHTTWAVIVGITGEEENRFYKKRNDGADVFGNELVREGAGVTLMPDDVHSIHITDGAPVLNFHMYGLALEQLPGRNYWNEKSNEWKVFPPHTDIREAR